MPSPEYVPVSTDSVVGPLLLRILECNWFGRSKSCKRYQADDLGLEDFSGEEVIQIGEGGFSKVFRCNDRNNNRVVAIKQIPILDVDEGVPSFIIREVSLLKELQHDNVISLLDVMIGEKKVNLVFEHLDYDLHRYITNELRFTKNIMIIKHFMHQILSAVAYCHAHKILHRDLKPKNLLIDNYRLTIKLADFGLAREFADPDMLYTENIATQWYRAPEILLDPGQYSTPVDLWSVGCIFGEMVLGMPIFPAMHCQDELEAIFKMLGTPTEETWPGVTKLGTRFHLCTKFSPMDLDAIFANLEPEGRDLLTSLLCLDPKKRISAERALKHAYFNDLNLVSS